jgi:uncharacterized protein (TIGR02217 family)
VALPTAIGKGTSGGPTLSTVVATLASGYERRAALWASPLNQYSINTELLDASALYDLLSFFRCRYGRAQGFRYTDLTDYTALGQVIGVGDGATNYFQLVKTYPDDSYPTARMITKPRSGTLSVFVGGVLQTEGYSVNWSTGVVTFATAPVSGAAIVADFSFDVPVRFSADELQITAHFNLPEGQDAICVAEHIGLVDLMGA